ncbi:hypothetical protein BS47DRAFT_626606 [Hydnum rufescens UP504]|uniref:DUF676 domain-containing protein n=1 Tax=Hydnum rufescens UP504 TaxID=1448309 RepID=A0A9P6B2W0_9AGAM|nr:hypothetical protein BS47DRAFT_626606 [Hydnum rufescens UP504]
MYGDAATPYPVEMRGIKPLPGTGPSSPTSPIQMSRKSSVEITEGDLQVYPSPLHVHAVFLCHGLWGEPSHMYALRDALKSRADREDVAVSIHCCSSYRGKLSYDGVDVCADRVVDEVQHEVDQLKIVGKRVVRFSILGYSLGGLIARLAVFLLNSHSFFERIQPCNFTTIASPAIGLPLAPGFIPKKIRAISAFFLSRTGTHLFLTDKGQGSKIPLIQELSTPRYTRVLANFERVDIYANAILDRMVPYVAGGITTDDPFMEALATAGDEIHRVPTETSLTLDRLQLVFDERYPDLISTVETIPKDEMKSVPKSNLLSADRPKSTLIPCIAPLRPWFTPSTYPFLPRPLRPVLVGTIPLVIPAVLLVVVTFTIQGVKSRIRIKRHFRHRAGRTWKSRVWDDLEDHIQPPSRSWTAATTNSTSTGSTVVHVNTNDLYPTRKAGLGSNLSTAQHDMIDALNKSIPNMKKHVAFFPGVFTSHTVIVCQDQHNIVHRRGLAIVQHWADIFQL